MCFDDGVLRLKRAASCWCCYCTLTTYNQRWI